MNHIRNLLHRTPMDTRDAKKLLAQHLGVNWFTVQKMYLDQYKEMSAGQVLRSVQFFSQFFECTFEDVYSLDSEAAANELGIVHPDVIKRYMTTPRRGKALNSI